MADSTETPSDSEVRRHFEEAVRLAMKHGHMPYSEALELLLTPMPNHGGRCVVEFVRSGQAPLARKALSELIDNRKSNVNSGPCPWPRRFYF